MGHDAPHGPRVPAIAAVLAAGIVVGGCAWRHRDDWSDVRSLRLAPPPRPPRLRARTSAPIVGPTAPDAGLLRRAEGRADLASAAGQGPGQPVRHRPGLHELRQRAQLHAARQATHPAAAKAMTALADDYTALVHRKAARRSCQAWLRCKATAPASKRPARNPFDAHTRYAHTRSPPGSHDPADALTGLAARTGGGPGSRVRGSGAGGAVDRERRRVGVVACPRARKPSLMLPPGAMVPL